MLENRRPANKQEWNMRFSHGDGKQEGAAKKDGFQFMFSPVKQAISQRCKFNSS